MREFINIVEALNTRTLYHGTGILQAASILSQNELNTYGGADDGPLGMSLTRSPKVASSFGEAGEEREIEILRTEYGYTPKTPNSMRGVVLMFDWDKLAAAHKVEPFDWGGTDDSEEEERIHGEKIPNVRSYITNVQFNQDDVDWWIDNLTELSNMIERSNWSNKDEELGMIKNQIASLVKFSNA